jgi:predicted nucleotidyltransferase
MRSRSSPSVKVFSPPYSREEVIELLRLRLPSLNKHLPLQRAVLFGSYARGNYTAFSDIDLLVVYAGPPRENAFALTVKTLALRGLQPHVLSEEEFQRVEGVWKRMLEGGVELWPAAIMGG